MQRSKALKFLANYAGFFCFFVSLFHYSKKIKKTSGKFFKMLVGLRTKKKAFLPEEYEAYNICSKNGFKK
jgi:hypothetical protein